MAENTPPDAPLPCGQDSTLTFEPIYADWFNDMYRIHDLRAESGVAHPNLLENAGFDELKGTFRITGRTGSLRRIQKPGLLSLQDLLITPDLQLIATTVVMLSTDILQ